MKGSDGKDTCEAGKETRCGCQAPFSRNLEDTAGSITPVTMRRAAFVQEDGDKKSAVRRRTWGNGRKVIYQPLLLPISIPNDGFAAWEVDTSRVLGCAGPLRSSCRRRISALHGALHTHLEVDVTLRFRRAGCVGYRCRAGSKWPATSGRSSKALPVSEVQAREGRRRTAGGTHRGM